MKHANDLNEAIEMLTKLVWWAESSTEIKRIDFGRVATSERPAYEAAMALVMASIKNGEITKDEFIRRVGIE